MAEHDHNVRLNQFSVEQEIRIHALNLAVTQFPKVISFKDEDTKTPEEQARATLVNAKLYEKWLMTGEVD